MKEKHELIFGYDSRAIFDPVGKEATQTSRWKLLEEHSCDCQECLRKLETYEKAINYNDFIFTDLKKYLPEHIYRLVVKEKEYTYDIDFEEVLSW